MKTNSFPLRVCHKNTWTAVLSLGCLLIGGKVDAEPTIAENTKPLPPVYEIQKSRVVPLPHEGRNLIIQKVKPPVLPAPPVAQPHVPLDPEVLAKKREEWRKNAPRETRLLTLRAVIYDNGLTLLQWDHYNERHEREKYEAWTTTDFRSLWLTSDFDVNDTRYFMFPLIYEASARQKALRPLPGPLEFGKDSPGYLLVSGDPSNLQALNPITALHQIYKKEGPDLQMAWSLLVERRAEAKAWEAAHPTEPQDTVIRLWPKVSRRHATNPARQPEPVSSPSAQ